jgi:hypothetical protein
MPFRAFLTAVSLVIVGCSTTQRSPITTSPDVVVVLFTPQSSSLRDSLNLESCTSPRVIALLNDGIQIDSAASSAHLVSQMTWDTDQRRVGTMEALNLIATSLHKVPGTKRVVLVGSGIPIDSQSTSLNYPASPAELGTQNRSVHDESGRERTGNASVWVYRQGPRFQILRDRLRDAQIEFDWVESGPAHRSIQQGARELAKATGGRSLTAEELPAIRTLLCAAM